MNFLKVSAVVVSCASLGSLYTGGEALAFPAPENPHHPMKRIKSAENDPMVCCGCTTKPEFYAPKRQSVCIARNNNTGGCWMNNLPKDGKCR